MPFMQVIFTLLMSHILQTGSQVIQAHESYIRTGGQQVIIDAPPHPVQNPNGNLRIHSDGDKFWATRQPRSMSGR